MEQSSYSVSAPGTIMLFGEHAVLHKKQAVAAAVDRYINVTLTPRSDNKIIINSKDFGRHITSIEKFKIIKKYNFVLCSIEQNLKKIKSGFELEIKSDFSSKIGFGSSAAVVVSTLSVLDLWLKNKNLNLMSIYKKGVKVVRLIQGAGSGADIAASVFGGIISYKTSPLSIKKISSSMPLVAVYSGNKLKTKLVVEKVTQRFEKFPVICSDLFQAIDSCSKKAITTIKKKDWRTLGKLMDIHQGVQDALGVSNEILSDLTFSLRSKNSIYGAKISGSGLGDCVIGLGKLEKNNFPKHKQQKKIGVKQIDFNISEKGLHVVR